MTNLCSILRPRTRRKLIHLDHVSDVRCVVGRPAKPTFGVVIAATSGTRSTLEASVRLVFISGPQLSVSPAHSGRHIQIGTLRIELGPATAGAVHHPLRFFTAQL